mgnify:CR=1 FL=1
MAGDALAVKLAMVAGGVLLLGYFGQRAASAIPNAVGAAWQGAGTALGDAGRFIGQHAGTSFNPASDQNLVYQGVNQAGTAATGDPNWSLGGWFYDLWNPDVLDPILNPTPPPAPFTSGGGGQFNGHGASGSWGDTGALYYDIPGSEFVMYHTGASGSW